LVKLYPLLVLQRLLASFVVDEGFDGSFRVLSPSFHSTEIELPPWRWRSLAVARLLPIS
jgi:hypothetical protein